MNTEDIINELRRKYQDTYIFIEPNGKEILAYVSSLQINGHGDDASGVMTLTTEEVGVLQYLIPSDQVIRFKPVRKGVFQLGKKPYLVSRTPARQWKRGVCESNTSFIDLSTYWCGLGNQRLSLELVNAAFKAETYRYHEAIKMMASGKYVGVAMKSGWYVLPSIFDGAEKEYTVFHELTPVARINREGELLSIITETYEKAFKEMHRYE